MPHNYVRAIGLCSTRNTPLLHADQRIELHKRVRVHLLCTLQKFARCIQLQVQPAGETYLRYATPPLPQTCAAAAKLITTAEAQQHHRTASLQMSEQTLKDKRHYGTPSN
jgi:predicted phage tail protein